MRWPPWSSNSNRDDDKKHPVSWTDSLNATDWSHYTDPRTAIPTILLTTTILVSVRFYRSYLRRIPEASHIKPGFFRKRSLFGTVTRVGDGDNFHLFHTPGGRLAGWGWLRGRQIPAWQNKKGNTVHRLLRSIGDYIEAHKHHRYTSASQESTRQKAPILESRHNHTPLKLSNGLKITSSIAAYGPISTKWISMNG